MELSPHAQQRLQQRGLSRPDISLILAHGTETNDGFFLRRRDAKEAERMLRKQISQLHRLVGKFVVTDGDTIVTAYHPGKTKQKAILRH